MIPEAAVEAALAAYYASIDADTGGPQDDMRAALEAAAPHMLAEAWDAGEEAGQDNADANRGFSIEHKRNPYEAKP